MQKSKNQKNINILVPLEKHRQVRLIAAERDLKNAEAYNIVITWGLQKYKEDSLT